MAASPAPRAAPHLPPWAPPKDADGGDVCTVGDLPLNAKLAVAHLKLLRGLWQQWDEEEAELD